MSTGPSFRAATEADAAELLVFMREYYAFDGHGYDEAKARVALTALLRDSSLGRVWLILDGQTRAGYVVLCFGYSLEWLGRDAFVDELYLREQYRGRGWGRHALDYVEGEARIHGIKVLHLGVVEGNTRALKLYRELGFIEHTSTFLSKWIAPESTKPQGRHGY